MDHNNGHVPDERYELTPEQIAYVLSEELGNEQIGVDDVRVVLQCFAGSQAFQDELQKMKTAGIHMEFVEDISAEAGEDLGSALEVLESIAHGDESQNEFYIDRLVERLFNDAISTIEVGVAQETGTDEDTTLSFWIDDLAHSHLEQKNPRFYEIAFKKAVNMLVLIALRKKYAFTKDGELYYAAFGSIDDDRLQSIVEAVAQRAIQSAMWTPEVELARMRSAETGPQLSTAEVQRLIVKTADDFRSAIPYIGGDA